MTTAAPITTPIPVEYANASAAVRAVYRRHQDHTQRSRLDKQFLEDDLARDEALLTRTWESVKEVMAPGALDPLAKEMLYLAVSVTNGCDYCIAEPRPRRPQAGHDGGRCSAELLAVVGMANETNRLANGYRVPVDAAFET